MGNTEEFIGLYHRLWDYLRQSTDSSHGTGFDELVDKAAEKNGIVKSEAGRIKDFAKNGNTIRNYNFYQFAEPTKKALSEFKRLVDNVISPKNLIPTFQAEIKCFSPKTQLVTALRYMRDNDFSQAVIREKGKLSLLTAEGVAKWLEQQADKDVITLAKVKVGDALACDLSDTFEVMGTDDTIYQAQQAFKNSIERSRPRLFAVIITDNGKITGEPIGIVTPWDLTPAEAPSEDYVFRKQEDFWNIVFEGKSILLKDTKGLQYIAYLLHYPFEEFHASKLIVEVGGPQVEAAGSSYGKMSADQLEGYNLRVSGLGDAGELLDNKAKEQYTERRNELREELAEAKRNDDLGRISKLTNEIEWIEDKISEAYGLGGRSRKAADSSERARQAILAAITRGMGKIEKANPALWRHLDNTIHTGLFCSYRPEEPISWSS